MKEKEITRTKGYKKPHIWVPLIVFVILAGIMCVFSTMLFEVIFYFNLDNKMTAEYEQLKYIASVYDTYGQDAKLFVESGVECIVTDENGNVLYSNCEDTRAGASSKTYLADLGGSVRAYEDRVENYVQIRDEALYVSYLKLPIADAIANSDGFFGKKNAKRLERSIEDLTVEELMELNTENFLQLPIWMSVKLSDGKTEFIGKLYYNIKLSDLVTLLFMSIILLFFIVIVFIILLVNAITNSKRHKRMLKLFYTDTVTGGKNAVWFAVKGTEILSKKAEARNAYAFVNLGFVDYRSYCMCHSVEEGQRSLRRVNEIIESHLARKEYVAHISSSNFILILNNDEQERLRERITALIRELERIDSDHIFHFQAGVEVLPANIDASGRAEKRRDLDVEAEYNNAVAARATMSKSSESGVAFFDTELIEKRKWIDKVQEHQASALSNEEFQVYYQPKYNPVTKELRGAEALIRWQSPEFGFVSPGKFIPIFEENGFITEIDHYMINHVAADQKRWLDEGYKCVPVSVNVSRAHFVEDDLAEQIRDMVDAQGTPHEYIEIELTESAFFDDKDAMIKTIKRLKEYGFAVSMDDFGSGYSSLNSLKDMPLDVLKLDAEFFRGDLSDERGEKVVSEAIKLAKSLNMRTVAEGIEVKEQVEFLANQGCDMIQGYYFAKPMPKGDYEDRMKAGVAPENE